MLFEWLRPSRLRPLVDPYNWRNFNQFNMAALERCLLCQRSCVTSRLCAPCTGDLPWNIHPVSRGLPRNCSAFAAFRYEFPISRLIWSLKFKHNAGVGQVLGQLMADALWARQFSGMLICSVPLSFRRQASRGFNQSAILATALAEKLGCALDLISLRRVRHTVSQRGEDRVARARNVRDAFTAASAVAGQRIVLVDDVMTTGATLLSARRALLQAGAAEVSLLACAAVV